jgi:hypothetical protein
MSSTIFNLGAVKLLKKILRFQESDIQIITGNSADPTVTAVDAVAGSIYIRGGTNEVYVKNTSGSNTDFSKLGTVDSLNAHINDTSDAHDASAISNVPAGNLVATDVQGALNELQSELDGKALASDLSNHLSDATDAHDASAISSVASGNLVSTDVQSALNELQSDIDTRALASDLSNHLSDAVDAHDASAISNIPSGNLAATDLQSAVNELQSDIDTRALDNAVIKKDGSVAFTAAQSMGGFKITSLAAGTASSDAVNKGQLDAALEGLKPKAAVRVATTADIVIATALNAGDVIDGITLANGDRVLVKDQTAAEANGIYVVSATPARSTDFDSLSPIDEVNGSLVAVQEGAENAGKVFVQSGAVAVLDTDPINFVFFNSSSALVGGDGITVSGSNVSVDHDGQGLQIVSTQLALELDGTTLSKSASGLKVGTITSAELGSASVTDAAVATGIDAVKLADGSVTNTELQYINSLTSNAQTQLDNKEPLHNTTLVQATNASLGSTVTDEVVSGLTFAHASFNGCVIDYRIQKGTLVRVGKMLVATDGTNVSLNDSFVETVDSTVVFEAVVNGANINIRHTNTESGTMTMTYQQNKFAV